MFIDLDVEWIKNVEKETEVMMRMFRRRLYGSVDASFTKLFHPPAKPVREDIHLDLQQLSQLCLAMTLAQRR